MSYLPLTIISNNPLILILRVGGSRTAFVSRRVPGCGRVRVRVLARGLTPGNAMRLQTWLWALVRCLSASTHSHVVGCGVWRTSVSLYPLEIFCPAGSEYVSGRDTNGQVSL